MNGGTQTTQSTSSTAPSNPMVTATMNQLLTGVQSEYAKGPKVNPELQYAGAGSTTQQGWNSALGAANNQNFTSGLDAAIADQSKVASGDYLNQMDPNAQALIDRTANQTAADINASMGADGAYGSNIHTGALGDTIGALRQQGAMDNRNFQYGRQQAAMQNLPQLYSARQLPASTFAAVGGAQDANTQAEIMARNDLFRKQNDAGANWLGQFTSILNGNAQTAGNTTTQTNTTPTPPLWSSLLGLGLAFA